MSDDRWYFSKEALENSPSRRCGIDADQELNYRQLAANLIHDMGSRKHLAVNQLCISTAMVYMHRFYVYHSFTHFQWNAIAMASLFLAAKVEEQTRKIEHIIKVAHWCLQRSQISIDNGSKSYADQVQELVMNENILLQTLGFDVAVKHPHAFIVEFSERLKYNKELTKTMYGMASNSLHITTMCVRYKPSVVACFCVHFVCKWSNHEIQKDGEELPWWTSIDPSVTLELLKEMTEEFLEVFEKSPPGLKNKVNELLRIQIGSSSRNPINNSDRKPNTNEHPLSGSSGHSLNLISSSSGSSSSSSLHPKNHRSSMNHHNVPAANRVHKSSTTHLPNQRHSSHPPINGGLNVNPNSIVGSSQHVKSDSTAHVSSKHHHQRHLQLQQHHHHRHHVQISQNPHKIGSSGLVHNAALKPKINPVTFGLPKTNGSISGSLLAKETKPEQRNIAEMRLKPGLNVERDVTAAAVASITNHRNPAEAAVENTRQKMDLPREFKWPVTNSRSNFISNTIKEMTMAKQNEIKSNPPEIDTVDSAVVTKPSRNHSIFSPSPPPNHVRFNLPLVEERTLPVEVEIKQEPVIENVLITPILPAEVEIKQEILPSEFEFSTMKTPPNPMNDRYHSGIFLTNGKMVGTVSNLNEVIVPSTSAASRPPNTNIPVITNVVSLAPPLNEVTIKDESCEIGKKYVEIPNVSSQPTIPNLAEENAVCVGNIDTNIGSVVIGASSSTSHSHKKKKKHKEKDKKHKEKKRHKDEKHDRRKEHSRREKERPSPIKITIPKEKLIDIPVKLNIKINKDPILQPSTSGATKTDIAVKIGTEEASKSRKRKRESNHDHTSKKPHCNASTASQNGF